MKSNSLVKRFLRVVLSSMLVISVATGCGSNKAKESSGDVQSEKLATSYKQLPMFEGEKVDKSFLKKSDYTLLTIWSTGCGACMEEIKTLEKISKEYDQKKVRIAGLLYGTAKDKVPAYKILKERGATYVNVIPSDKFFEEFVQKETAVPYSLLVDSNGNIKKAFVGALPYDSLKQVIDSNI